jgi:ATP-dependent Lon protease
VKEILGHERRELEVAERTAQSGVATGLAWTSVGGEILFIEAAASKGKGELRLTGQLGDVMKESALAALTLLKSRAADLGIDAEELGSSDVHLHIPAGAVPKDGPSAGVAITVALASLFTDRPVRGTVAMTGEILLPERNMADLVELPEVARQKLEFIPLHTIDDAFDVALGRHRS